MKNLRAIHRFVTLFIVLFALFLGVTGTTVQSIDLWSIYTHVPATDRNIRAMRESFDGPGDFLVRTSGDYLAQPLPAGSDYPGMLARLISSTRATIGNAPLKYAEFRMIGTRPVGQVGVGEGHVRFDAASGALLEKTDVDRQEDQSPASPRNTFKQLHRMTTFGDWALFINVIVAAGLATLIVTGLIIYLTILRQRRKIGRPNLFWTAGGTWRSLHRAVSILAAVFLSVVTLSGAWLAVESLAFGIYMHEHMPQGPGGNGPPGGPGGRPRMPGHSSPLRDSELPSMLRVTLASAKAEAPNDPVKAIRLRYYSGYAQGVVVTGGDNSQQLVFNARSGAPMSETEPGYPTVGFPFGWQAHEVAKNVHRGDYIGLPGRWMDLLAGLSMIYLGVSGIVMYWELWTKRRRAGRKALIWN